MTSNKIYAISFIATSLLALLIILVIGKDLFDYTGFAFFFSLSIMILLSCGFGCLVCLIEHSIINSGIREVETISEEVYRLNKHAIELITKSESHYDMTTKMFRTERKHYLYVDNDKYDIDNSECLYVNTSYVKIINKRGLNRLGEVIYFQVFEIPASLKK